jgi:uncharacterized membrane protein
MRQALRFSALCYPPPVAALPFPGRLFIDLPGLHRRFGSGRRSVPVLLSKAYQHGQVSVAYPIARSFPILVVTWVLFLWGVTPSAVGLVFLISHSLIIMALTSDPVSYMVSFRQISILITALISMFWIEREVSSPRLVGVATIFVGVVLVGLA